MTLAFQYGITEEQLIDSSKTVGLMAASTIPGVGEALDHATLSDPEASEWEKELARLSLTVSFFTAGYAPNFGSFRGLFKRSSKTAGEVGQQVARHGDEAADATRQLCNGDYCFPAGTLVATDSGSRPIETVEVGEPVWSLDMTTEQWELRSIRRRSRLEYEGRIIRLQIAGETVESTEHHPFWVVSGNNLEDRPRPKHAAPREVDTSLPGRWVDAVHLEHYDTLQLMSGLHVVITSIETRTANEPVYNFDVEDHHCYAVGNQAVLVHNNIDDCLKGASDAAPKTIKLELPGSWPNGAKITIQGKTATIHVEGVDSADDLVAIFRTARENGASHGSLFTGKVVNEQELARYVAIVKRGGTRFGGQVVPLGSDSFRLDFVSLPSF